MKTIAITNVRKNIFNIVKQIIEDAEPVQVVSKQGDVVMLSLEDWAALQETLYLLSVPGMREKILEGFKKPIEECKSLEDIGWHLD